MRIENIARKFQYMAIAGAVAGIGLLTVGAANPARAQAPYCNEKYPGNSYGCQYGYSYGNPYYGYPDYRYNPYAGHAYGYPAYPYPPAYRPY